MYIGKKKLVDNIDNEYIIKQFQNMKTRKKKFLILYICIFLSHVIIFKFYFLLIFLIKFFNDHS